MNKGPGKVMIILDRRTPGGVKQKYRTSVTGLVFNFKLKAIASASGLGSWY